MSQLVRDSIWSGDGLRFRIAGHLKVAPQHRRELFGGHGADDTLDLLDAALEQLAGVGVWVPSTVRQLPTTYSRSCTFLRRSVAAIAQN